MGIAVLHISIAGKVHYSNTFWDGSFNHATAGSNPASGSRTHNSDSPKLLPEGNSTNTYFLGKVCHSLALKIVDST